MSAEQNKNLVRRFFEEAWGKGNVAAVDEFMATGYMEHPLPSGLPPGPEGLKQLIVAYRSAFPDLEFTLDDIFAEGDRVAFRWSARGTHLGDWLGIPPTGNHVTATGITVFRIVDEKVVESWTSIDLSPTEEELRSLSEGGDILSTGRDPSPPIWDVLTHNLTWRFRVAEARERERIEQELRVARQIQQSLLPAAPPELEGWEITSYYQPAREVGGDFYDFLELPDGRLGLVIGDATGHGMPAALVMATTRGMLRAVAQSLDSPGEVLARVNDALGPDIPPNTFVTCFYATLDPVRGRLRYANAGHDLPYLHRHGEGAYELWATGMPLGLMPAMDYEENELSLEEGDRILFYSDGLVEAHDPQGEMFGFPRLRQLVGSLADGSLVDHLLKELSGFVGDGWEQEDDITLLTLQRSRAT